MACGLQDLNWGRDQESEVSFPVLSDLLEKLRWLGFLICRIKTGGFEIFISYIMAQPFALLWISINLI